MPAKKPPKYPNLMSANAEANRWLKDFLSNTPLGIPNLDEEDFGKVMDAVVKAAMAGWVDGFQKARE